MFSRLATITNAQVGLLLGILAVVGLGISALAHILDTGMSNAMEVTDWWAWMDGAFQNFSTEVIGAILTFGLIEVLIGERDRRKADEEQRLKDEKELEEQRLKDEKELEQWQRNNQLQGIAELKGSQTREQQQAILDRMGAMNLFEGAYLEGIDWQEASLVNINLSKANLRRANLERAFLYAANLDRADLRYANLQEADLRFANLDRADLRYGNLQRVGLVSASLTEVNLAGADLRGAAVAFSSLLQSNLRNTKLQGADLRGTYLDMTRIDESTQFDSTTILPDATLLGSDEDGKPIFDKYWTPETNMSRYTNPDHSEFRSVFLAIKESQRSYMDSQVELHQVPRSYEGQDLSQAELRGSDLAGVNLQRADLWKADLREADLREANLKGAYLDGASLYAANLEGAILPDGTKWEIGTSIDRFTDPNHPNFWRPPNENQYDSTD